MGGLIRGVVVLGHAVFLPLLRGLLVGSEGPGSLGVRGGINQSPSRRPVPAAEVEGGGVGLVLAWMGRSGLWLCGGRSSWGSGGRKQGSRREPPYCCLPLDRWG